MKENTLHVMVQDERGRGGGGTQAKRQKVLFRPRNGGIKFHSNESY